MSVPMGAGTPGLLETGGPKPGDGGAGAVYEQVVVDGIGDDVGPGTFLRPARD
jgi:hypothetical protein